MALETGSYIGNLVSSNPTGSDRKLQGDDHLRLIKSVLQNCFGGFTGSILTTGTNGGVANTYTLTPTPPLVSYVVNMGIVFTPTFTSSGPSTINISGLGPIEIRAVDAAPLIGTDLVAGKVYEATYDGTYFILGSLTKRYVDQLAFSAALPLQTGNSGKFLTTDGTNASWTDTFTIPIIHTSRLDEAKGANIASAATINLSTATGNLIHITGTTGITAITIPSGAERTLVFDGILTLTHNATTLILPTGANITTAVNDTMVVRGDGAGNARVISYQRANGAPLAPPGLRLLATLTPTAAANVDALTTFISTSDNYRIVIEGVKPSADDSLLMRYGNAGAADSGSNYAAGVLATGNFGAAGTSQSISSTVTTAGIGASAIIEIVNANSTTSPRMSTSISVVQSAATPTYTGTSSNNIYLGANAISGVRFFWSGGANFVAQGSIRIYAYSNS